MGIKPAKAIAELAELRLLRHVLAEIPNYQTGNVQVKVNFKTPIKNSAVRREIDRTAMKVLKQVLPAEEMRSRMTTKVQSRIAAIVAKYPGVVDEE